MLAKTLGVLALAGLTLPTRAATIVNFDDLPASFEGPPTTAGTAPFFGLSVPTGYSSLMSFTVANGALYVYAQASFWSSPPPASLPNVVCPTREAVANAAFCTQPLTVTFTQAVDSFSFWAGAWDEVGTQLAIEIYTGNSQLAGQLLITSPQRNNTHGIIDVTGLSGITGVTSVRILPPALSSGDRNGLVFDNFTIGGTVVIDPPLEPPVTPPVTSSPEASSLGMFTLGCGVTWWRLRKRR